MHQRARYLGLYPDSKGGGVHVNIGTGPNAESEGIQVEFVRCVRWGRAEDDKAKIAKVVEGLPQPMLKPL
jgi:hypothetical protein